MLQTLSSTSNNLFYVMEHTPNPRIIEELREASIDTVEVPMIGLQPTEENQNIESLIFNAMADEEAENEEIICQTSSDTGDINMSSSYVIVTERPAANPMADEKIESEDINMCSSYVVVNEKPAAIAVADEKNESGAVICQHVLETGQKRDTLMENAMSADVVQNMQLICQNSAELEPVRDITMSDIVVVPRTIDLFYSKYRTVESHLIFRSSSKDPRTLVFQNIPDSFEISSIDGQKWIEKDTFTVEEGENKCYVTLVPKSPVNTEGCFIFSITETGQVINVKVSAQA